jgi:glycosyltransferase involved in cell wall biosynthesis
VAADPSVSVVLPTRDRAQLLERAVGSVLGQSWGDLELIVIDDGSRDETPAILSRIQDPRLRCVRSQSPRGAPHARNLGIRHARGRYVAFQDSDDEWLPHKLERQIHAIEGRQTVGVAYCDMYRVRTDGWVFYHRSPSIVRGRLVDPATRYWQTYMLGAGSAVVRRECLQGASAFDESLRSFEDLDLFLRLALEHDFVHVREPLVHYHAGEGVSVDRGAELAARRSLVRKHLRRLLRTDPLFAVREAVDVALKRSLLPIVDRHLTLMTQNEGRGRDTLRQR